MSYVAYDPFRRLPIDPQVDALVTLFVEADQYIAAEIEQLVRQRRAAGTARYLRVRRAAIHAVLDQLQAAARDQAPKVVEAAFRLGGDIAALGFGLGINVPAVDLLAQEVRRKLDHVNATVGRRVDDVFRQVGLKSVAIHVLEGSGHQAAAKAMREQLIKRGQTGFVDRAGRQWRLATYTEMVIRTTTREAVSQGTFQGLVDTGKQLVQVSKHVNSCKICLPLQGRTYALPNANASIRAIYPVISALPPFHPNCKHVIGPAGVEFDRLEADLLARQGVSA